MQHKRACACGAVAYAAHNWSSGEIFTPATHTTVGTKHYTCTDCGEVKEEDIPKLSGHTYGAWEKHNAMQHKRACACGAVAYAAHNWSSGEITAPATHDATGVKTYVCIDCGEEKTESLPQVAHSYGEWITVDEAALDKAGKRERYCACGDVEEEEIPPLTADDGEQEGAPLPPSEEEQADGNNTAKDSTVAVVVAATGTVLLGGGTLAWLLLRRKKRIG